MLLVTHKVKDAWRSGKVAAALFLDVQGAFPNTVKEQLIHNMRMRHVPSCFINIVAASLTGRTTRLKFDDHLSDALQLNNGTTQGDPSSMLYYSFYNAPLIEVATSADELSPGFINDTMILAIGNTITQCHTKLKDMMERPGGCFEWSYIHNSPFELTKTALMNFPRSYRDPIPGSLSLDKPNQDGSTSNSLTAPVMSYKYLWIIFNSKLWWSLQHTKALTAASFWASRIWRLAKSASGISTSGVKQLYNTVAVPRFTYGAEVWYTPLHCPNGSKNMCGSVKITNKLCTAQRKISKVITGGLSTMAGDILDAHAYMLPIDLLFNKLLFRSMLRLCLLPKSHSLQPLVRKAAKRKVKRHLSPIHNLIQFARINPRKIEVIDPVRRSPGYVPTCDLIIPPSKDAALTFANLTNATVPVRIYSDGSGFEGGIGASALLYINDKLTRSLRCYLGTPNEHTVYEAEGVGLLMGLHLLNGLSRQLTLPTVLGSDSQAAIRALGNQRAHSGQYLLNAIHVAAEQLHSKQDGLINRAERQRLINLGESWAGKCRRIVDLQVHWVPGHKDFAPNERADEEAKLVAQGHSSDAKFLLLLLRKCLPLSVSALWQSHSNMLKNRWRRRWKNSERENLLRTIDNSAPSKKYLRLIKGLDCHQASLLFQLRSGHIGLNHHLFHIRKSEMPSCPLCQGITVETVKHFLLDCPHYSRERHELRLKLRRNAGSLSFLLNSPVAVLPLLKFVHSTGRFKSIFGKDKADLILTNSRRNAELRVGLDTIVRNAKERVRNLTQNHAPHAR